MEKKKVTKGDIVRGIMQGERKKSRWNLDTYILKNGTYGPHIIQEQLKHWWIKQHA